MKSAEKKQTRKILVVFYSFTGETAKLAEAIAKGAKSVVSTEVSIKRVPELIAEEVFQKNPKLRTVQKQLEKKYPIATMEDLAGADGIAFGTPVHFGSFASQIKQFLDQFSPMWLEGRLVNKPAAVFCSSGSLHGGEEVTLMSMMLPLFNLGMIPVGIPYPVQGEGPSFDSGSPYGAIFVSGHSKNGKLSKDDAKAAEILGRRLAVMAEVLNCGCETCQVCHGLTWVT